MKQPNTKLNPYSIKQQIDPGAFYTREQHLIEPRYPSRAWIPAGLCPFHDDQHEGNFFICTKNGAFKCFSCGAKGGDIINFIQQKYQLGFGQALKKLSFEWGVR